MKKWVTKKNGYRVYRALFHMSNVFLITTPEKTILVDTSWRFGRKRLCRNLNRLGISRIDYLLLTHTHHDHVSNARYLQETYGAKVLVHQEGAAIVTRGESIVPKGTTWISRLIAHFIEKYVDRFIAYDACTPDIVFPSLYSFQQEGIHIQILSTPGHSVDSISILVDDEIVIAGDALFGVFPHSIFPPFADNIPRLIESWDKLLETPALLFLPAHGFSKKRRQIERSIR
ncbi:hydroxyacylglutathione hydrolase [Parabacteroides sp. PFB2-10]|uniref:MBL fold metallo-hydrolase n=1 Tax=Parabacteroides sp. PFB2-10 TaxID=1742405 RepID=UPI00247503DB|nr:MBL fold metallo-hydrolase [Parabacteroides sp. PFB2-10]MDH6313284.1 hydroxyacylglutathione hydrolase [Parabacteroides sp. PFB2-10]